MASRTEMGITSPITGMSMREEGGNPGYGSTGAVAVGMRRRGADSRRQRFCVNIKIFTQNY
jgi:hypothetical protein